MRLDFQNFRLGKRVLVVEDHDTLRTILVQTLANAGYDSLDAANGTQAVRLCQRIKFDLIIMDYAMPGMNGPEAIRTIRSREQAETPILGLTGYDGGWELRHLLEAGANHCIIKPCDHDTLIEWVSSLTQPHRSV